METSNGKDRYGKRENKLKSTRTQTTYNSKVKNKLDKFLRRSCHWWESS